MSKFEERALRPRNSLQPKEETHSNIEEVREKNLFPYRKTDATPSTKDGGDRKKRKREDSEAEDNSLLKRLKKGIGLYDDKENRDPRSSEIGPNGQVNDAQKIKMAKELREQLEISQEEFDKFNELGSNLSKIDPEDSEAIKHTIAESGLTSKQLEKFNKLLDASKLNRQGDQTNGESPEVKDTRNSQKNTVNGEKTSSEMPKITQADIDKLAQKIESSKRNWETFIELMMAMQTPGDGFPSA